MNSQELHEQVLYPIVRVRAEKAGGSGVLIYSQPDARHEGSHINLVLTCEHVVDDAIAVREEWDPVLKRDTKKDFFEEVTVELFDYDQSSVVSSNATPARIVAYDKHHDLAVLRLRNHRPLPFVARLLPEDRISSLRVFDKVWVSGCSLLHDPFPTSGRITYLREVIDQKTYLMSDASNIFGNSGGGLFLETDEAAYLLGLPSRVTTIQLGFGVDVITWMGFSTHPERVYEFFRHQELQFIFDPSDDFYAAEERREKRRQEALREILLGGKDA